MNFFPNSYSISCMRIITGEDFFLNRHIWTDDQYSRPTYIKNYQLADEGNPKYTLRHGLGWGFICLLPQGHVKVISRSNQPKRVRIFSCCCFCFNCINLGCYDGSNPLRPQHGGPPNTSQRGYRGNIGVGG